ncbi:MAG: hypothetical protein U0P45_00870 [Acidimicrobiales bacterium]
MEGPGGSPAPRSSGVSRRDVLRWSLATGVALGAAPVLAACQPVRTDPPLAPDPSLRALGFAGGTEGELLQGGWCWFQSPRASFGPGGLLWLGSSVSGLQAELDGSVQVIAFDTTTMLERTRRVIARTQKDDHTSPSVLALGDKAQVAWSLHQNVDYVSVGELTVDGAFTSQRIVRPGALKAPARGTAYASAHVVDGQRWVLYRGEQFSWNLLTSPDGKAWTGRGLVVAPRSAGDRPYVHAVSDGTRLHLLVTDGNPTEFRGTSVRAGTLGTDLRVRNSDGTWVGTVGSGAPTPGKLTMVAPGAPGDAEATDTDLWLCDLRYVDGAATGIISRRDPWPEGASAVGKYRHQYLWVRRRRTGWVVEPLAWAGGELCPSQPDYSGLATQDPTDPTRVVVSTQVHPISAEPLVSGFDGKVHFELFEGRRVGEGTWTWEPLTRDSEEDNIRPVIAAGGTAKALCWMRGKYWSWTDFDTRLVVRKAAGT